MVALECEIKKKDYKIKKLDEKIMMQIMSIHTIVFEKIKKVYLIFEF